MRVLPILFNTEMVWAILDGRKTVTRRLVKPQPQGCFEVHEEPLYIYDADDGLGMRNPPYQPGDILYVRETWQECCRNTIHSQIVHNKYCFKASVDNPIYGCIDRECGQICNWKPSIHMPKEAARIWLKVTDVRVGRLQEITPVEVVKEGAYEDCRECLESYGESGTQCCYKQDDECSQCDSVIMEFERLWNSTIKKSNLDRYGWDANPWVWVIEFERCEKPEEKK